MKSFNLKGKVRESVGKKAAAALRSEGKIPCNLYGATGNVVFSVEPLEVRDLIYSPDVFKVEIEFDNGQKANAVMKEIQFHPVNDNIMHIDFHAFEESKPIKVKIPVALEGVAAGVKTGGQLQKKTRLLTLKGLQANIPSHVSVNVEHLEVNQLIRVKDIETNGYEILDAPNVVVAFIKGKRGS
jgi:large subunit ribosomal protein L25